MLLIYEDAHWADPTTLELLGLVIERLQRLALLAVVTFGWSSPRPGPAYHTSARCL